MGSPEELAFRGVRVFDGWTMIPDRTVVVRGKRIERVLPAEELRVGRDRDYVEGAGRTLLPGFIDAHVHIGLHDPAAVLGGGITAARDLGWPADRVFPLAKELAADPTRGPLLFAAGPMITAPGGYPSASGWAPDGTGLEVGSETEAGDAVRYLVEQGASVIKVAQEPRGGPTMPASLLRTVVTEAHAVGLRVASHVGSLEQLRLALDAGVDELVHGLWSDETIPDAVIRRMADAGTVVVPTLHIDPSRERIDNLRHLIAGGVRVIYGTDLGNTGPPAGIDPEELRLMAEAGMSPAEALSAATSSAAEYLGLAGRGRIVRGAIADLVLVDGNPTEDFTALASPVMVLREGKLASR